MTDLLVIGYGNDLRSDDGAGRRVADAIAEMEIPGVEVRSVSQLAPELVIDIAGARRVVFVDANVDVTVMTVAAVAPGEAGPGIMTHHGDPASMLSLVKTIGEAPAEALTISIPALNLNLGFELSEPTGRAVAEAIEFIRAMAG